eukprot:gnl/TRDRNA2_/TRDRNA2_183398_c0_seq1.p1 gnl/TRDRNA2_/TRDRNA2_183398_c0~~gnl/TRDRNA2_/TRDRNA2_183398_c0_seq1.p1  ORF type:complete len:511 (+),score=92.64 gnl/TRDRNA2_/TRDRNA2_183398_c0_seq1:67-1599(+)
MRFAQMCSPSRLHRSLACLIAINAAIAAPRVDPRAERVAQHAEDVAARAMAELTGGSEAAVAAVEPAISHAAQVPPASPAKTSARVAPAVVASMGSPTLQRRTAVAGAPAQPSTTTLATHPVPLAKIHFLEHEVDVLELDYEAGKARRSAEENAKIAAKIDEVRHALAVAKKDHTSSGNISTAPVPASVRPLGRIRRRIVNSSSFGKVLHPSVAPPVLAPRASESADASDIYPSVGEVAAFPAPADMDPPIASVVPMAVHPSAGAISAFPPPTNVHAGAAAAEVHTAPAGKTVVLPAPPDVPSVQFDAVGKVGKADGYVVTEPVHAEPVERLDVDSSTIPYPTGVESFGRVETADRLTKSSVDESDAMVAQIEAAQGMEGKRAVYRALTRLRGLTIGAYDGSAHSQMRNVEHYSAVNHWRAKNPVAHLAHAEKDVNSWAFPLSRGEFTPTSTYGAGSGATGVAGPPAAAVVAAPATLTATAGAPTCPPGCVVKPKPVTCPTGCVVKPAAR